MFGAFFNLPFIEKLCRKVSGYSFDYRLIVTTFGVVRIQIKKDMALTTTATTSTLTSAVATSSTATTSVAATTGKVDRKGKRKQQVVITTDTSKRRKTQPSSGDDKMLKVDEQLSKLKDNMKEPTMELAQVNAEISKITNTLNSMAASFGSGNIGGSTKQQRQKRYKRKKLAQVDISSLVSSSTSKNDLIKNRSQMKARRDKLISQLLQIENSRSQLKDEKKEAFEEAYVEDNDTIIANTSPVFQATTSDQLLVGCDPGLSTMLQTTYADKQKVSFYLSLDNRFQPLEQFSQEMDLDDDRSIRTMMKLPTFPISSKDIDNKTMSKRSRTKMNNKKANDDTIMQTEADLADSAVNVALSYNKEAIIKKHKVRKN
ncbi:uncharacterized protein BX664DRAFT_83378 [Halteromyces radiatus]|uniref:uncharacterized protein n=1 Tax=Halteromyces radiatus TaxID=101107 RepID=UPI002220A66A|nr:uncharacterized protein BX664DRAFT_83378 [Halteromyces radiatus]KAI8097617.1 hypothetical protein BX664DRAFT_83378 [Halteromyces radiatus]